MADVVAEEGPRLTLLRVKRKRCEAAQETL